MSDDFLYQGINMPSLIGMLRNKSSITPEFVPSRYFNGNIRYDTPYIVRDQKGKEKKLNVSAGLKNITGKIELNIARCTVQFNGQPGIYAFKIPYQTSIDKPVRYAIRIYSEDLEDFLQVIDLVFTGSRDRIFRTVYHLAINKLYSSTDSNYIAEWYERISPWISVAIPYAKRIEHLDRMLSGIVSQYGFVDKEKAIINLLTSFTPKYNREKANPSLKELPNTNSTILLTELTKIGAVSKKILFNVIYDKLSDFGGVDNFTKGMLLLYELWENSIYKLPSYSLYKYNTSQTNITYSSEKKYGFFQSNLQFSVSGTTVVIKVEKTIQVNSWLTQTNDVPFGNYHIFQPLFVYVKKSESVLPVVGGIMPAFYLKTIADKNRWANIEKFTYLTIDVASLFIGVGMFLRLRHAATLLSRTGQAMALFNATVQVASGALGTMLNFVDENRYPKFCEKLRTVLLVIDLATLGGDFVTNSMLKKAAQDALDATPSAIRNDKRWVDVEEELEVLAEVERKGINAWDDGKLLSERMLRKRIATLLQEYKNFNLKVVFLEDTKNLAKIEDWNKRNVLGSFNQGPPPLLTFRKQVTELTWQHELWHLEDLKKMGSAKFYATPLWKHEQLVWERIWNSRGRWTEYELVDSYRYYKKKAKEETGEWISYKEMDDLLEKPYYKFTRYKK